MPTFLECFPLKTAVTLPVTHPEGTRRLTIAALITALMAIFLPLLGFSIDFGQMAAIRYELETRVQAAALAAAESQLAQHAGNASVTDIPGSQGPSSTFDADRRIELRFGCWNDQTHEFQEAVGGQANAVQAVGGGRAHPLYFSRLLGRDSFTASAATVGVLTPREIVLVLDYSPDSQAAIEAAVGQLTHRLANSRTDDRLALVLPRQQRGQATLPAPLSREPSLVTHALSERAPTTRRPTESLTAAIRLARRHLRKTGRPGTDHAIWLVSDREATTPRPNALARRRLENELSLIEEQSIRVDSILGAVPSGETDPIVQLTHGTTGQHRTIADVDNPDQLIEAFDKLESKRQVQLVGK